MLAPDANQVAVVRPRVPWLDNLRTGVVSLVVVLHAGGVYESSGGWSLFWIVDDPSTTPLSDLLILILDVLLMPTLFFVSGCVTPLSLATKSTIAFLKAKARRLLIPWLITVLTLIPLYKLIFLYSRSIPQEHWTTYFHWRALWGQNWLWFLPVLFCFNVLYLIAAKARLLPTGIPLKGVVAAIFLLGWAYSCCMDLLGLRGWTHTLVLDFQNERLLIYFLMFVLGAVGSRQKVFASQSQSKKLHITVAATACVAVTLYYSLCKSPVDAPDTYAFSYIACTLLLWLAFHAALHSSLYITLATFRHFMNRPSLLSRRLSDNSYYTTSFTR